MNLSESHRMSSCQLLAGSFAYSLNLCFGPPLAFCLSCHNRASGGVVYVTPLPQRSQNSVQHFPAPVVGSYLYRYSSRNLLRLDTHGIGTSLTPNLCLHPPDTTVH